MHSEDQSNKSLEEKMNSTNENMQSPKSEGQHSEENDAPETQAVAQESEEVKTDISPEPEASTYRETVADVESKSQVSESDAKEEPEVKDETSSEVVQDEVSEEVVKEEPISETSTEIKSEEAAEEPKIEEAKAPEVKEEVPEVKDEVKGEVKVEALLETPEEVKSEEAKEEVKAPEVKEEVPEVTDEAADEDDDEHTDEEDEDLEDQIAWDELNREELKDKLEECLQAPEAKDVRGKVNKIRDAYRKVKDEEIKIKKERYLENGGVLEDFETPFDEVDEAFHASNKKFRELRAKIRKDKEKELETNLRLREGLIEELKSLFDDTSEIPKRFEKLHDIEKNWRAIGHVPQLRAEELWSNFRFHRQNFYDLVHINQELRDLDHRKNLDLKTDLCEKAEALFSNESIKESLDTYKQLHDEWKQIGHVAKDVNETIWERFTKAGDRLYERRREYVESQQEVYAANLEKKKAIIAKTKELISQMPFDIHSKWQEATEAFAELMEEWKMAGFASRKENEEVWEEFKSIRSEFYNSKENFYKDLRNAQNENYKAKVDLCMRAEELKESTDWKKTADTLKELQEEWKKSGPVAKKHSDKLWKRFRTACDEFFNHRKEHFAEVNGDQEENLKNKEALIEKIKAYEHSEDGNETFEALREFQNEWISIGHVPIKQKEKIQKEYRSAIDAQFAKLKQASAETRRDAFKAQVQNISSDKGGKSKLQHQKNVVQDKIKRLQSDVQTLENNIGFFGNSKSKAAEDMKRDIQKKIAKAKEEIGQLYDQLKILKDN